MCLELSQFQVHSATQPTLRQIAQLGVSEVPLTPLFTFRRGTTSHVNGSEHFPHRLASQRCFSCSQLLRLRVLWSSIPHLICLGLGRRLFRSMVQVTTRLEGEGFHSPCSPYPIWIPVLTAVQVWTVASLSREKCLARVRNRCNDITCL